MSLRLENPHAVCYINAALQMLTQVHQDDWGRTPAAVLINALRHIKTHGNGTKAVSYWSDVNRFVRDDHKFQGMQGDAHEILLEILHCVGNDTLINTLFGLKMTSCTTCMACSANSERDSLETQFTVGNAANSLRAFFGQFFNFETLDKYHCDQCASVDPVVRTNAAIRTRVKEWPPYLLLHIMRFNGNAKITSPFDFPLVFVGAGPKDPEYVLESLILHIGSTRSSGHYVSLGRSDHGSFFLYNDDHVPKTVFATEMKTPEINQQVYILLYRKVVRKN
jgi:ubiquitin C-terminal hydrolase